MTPPDPRISDEQLIRTLTGLFQKHGFNGASLSDISAATGLQRASLYHRFPGGKDSMAQAVLDHVDKTFASHVLAPLTDDDPPPARLKRAAERIRAFFNQGSNSCVFDTLSICDADSPWRAHLAQSMTAWIDAFAALAREHGLTPARAKRAAEDAVAAIQGALVIARATGDTAPFDRALKALPDTLLPHTP